MCDATPENGWLHHTFMYYISVLPDLSLAFKLERCRRVRARAVASLQYKVYRLGLLETTRGLKSKMGC